MSAALFAYEGDGYMAANMRASCSLAWHALLRVGEFSYSGVFDPTKHACREDVTFHPSLEADTISHVSFRFKVYKTSQFRRAYTLVLYPTGTAACPVARLAHLFRAYPADPAGPVFDFRTKNRRPVGSFPVADRQTFTRQVNKLLKLHATPVVLPHEQLQWRDQGGP